MAGAGGSSTKETKPWEPAQAYFTGGAPMSGGGQGGMISYQPSGGYGQQSSDFENRIGASGLTPLGLPIQGGAGGGTGYAQSMQMREGAPGILPEAARLYAENRGLTPLQEQGQDYLRDYSTGGLMELSQAGQQGAQFLASGDVLRPGSNPYLRETADAYAGAVGDQLNRETLRGIDNQMVGAGQGWSSSQAGIERGLARGEASERIAENTARLYSDAYGRGLQAMQGGLGMLPSIGQFGAAPGQLQFDVANIAYDEEQRKLANYSNLVNQAASQGGQQVTPQSSGGATGALGGAAAGAAAGSAFGPYGTAIGAVGGGLLGAMG